MASEQIDWVITLVPLILILSLASLFFAFLEQSNQIVGQIRYVFGDTFGVYYLIIGLGILFVSIYLAGSKYGTIVLGGQEEKPKYSFWVWGSMMFTCGLAADILFYSFAEWVMYAFDPHYQGTGISSGMGRCFSSFSLEFYSLGFLFSPCRGFWLYASCTEKKSSEVFGSVSTYSWRTYRRMGRENHRFACGICPPGGNSNNIFCSYASDGCSNRGTFRDYSKSNNSDNCHSDHHLRDLYLQSSARN